MAELKKLQKLVRLLNQARTPQEKANVVKVFSSPAIFKKYESSLPSEALRDVSRYHPDLKIRNMAEEYRLAPKSRTNKHDLSDTLTIFKEAGIPSNVIKKPTKNSLLLIFPSKTTGALLKFDAGVVVIGKLDKQNEVEDAKPIKLDDKTIIKILQMYRKLDPSIDDRAKSLRSEGEDDKPIPVGKSFGEDLKEQKPEKSEKKPGTGKGKGDATTTQSALWYSAKSISRVTEELSHMAGKEGLDEATRTLLEEARDSLVKIYRTLELRLKR